MTLSTPDGAARAAIGDRLDSLFRDWADARAIQFGSTWWSWGDVGRLAADVERLLMDEEAPPRQSVNIVMRQTASMLAVTLGVMSRGRCAVLRTPIQPDAALANEIRTQQPTVVVADAADWGRSGFEDSVAAIGALGIEVVTEATTARVLVRVARTTEWRREPMHDAAITVLTSGTTGPPKRLPVGWEKFVALGGGPLGRNPKSNVGSMILTLPLVTLGGLISITRLVFSGRPVSVMERFDVATWAKLVREHKPRVVGAPPAALSMILDSDLPPNAFEGAEAFQTASAPVDNATAIRFEERFGIPVLVGYGATEFLGSATVWTNALWDEFGATKRGSVGRPVPGTRVRIVDQETGGELGCDELGIVEVDPLHRADGLPSGWLRTNDLGRIDDDGFLWIKGRADEVIIRGGFKVDLQSLELTLLEHPDVREACAVGLPDERLGSVPAAVVVADQGREPSETALTEWVRERIAPYAVPVIIRPIAEIPVTQTYKRRRAEVAAFLASVRESPAVGE